VGTREGDDLPLVADDAADHRGGVDADVRDIDDRAQGIVAVLQVAVNFFELIEQGQVGLFVGGVAGLLVFGFDLQFVLVDALWR
jgi:hypothetical protein